MIESLHDGPRRAAEFHHVIQGAHGEEEHVGEAENGKKGDAVPASPCVQHEPVAQNQENDRSQEVRNRADRIVESRKGVEIGTCEHLFGLWKTNSHSLKQKIPQSVGPMLQGKVKLNRTAPRTTR